MRVGKMSLNLRAKYTSTTNFLQKVGGGGLIFEGDIILNEYSIKVHFT